MEQFENILRPGFEPSMTKTWKPLVVQKFSRNLNPQTLQEFVLKSEKVAKLVEYYANTQSKSKREIYQTVKDILQEIGLERNELIIRMCGVVITAMG